MQAPKVRVCVRCGQPEEKGRPLSRSLKHPECGDAAMLDAIGQLRDARGPIYDKWREGIQRGVANLPPPATTPHDD